VTPPRSALAADAVAGVLPKVVHLPDTIADAASRIAESGRAGAALAFAGGGTDLEIGYPPEKLDALIRTERLTQVVEHAPSDQIMTVEAGVTVEQLQAVAGAQGQRLALDPPHPGRATVGGIVAANAFGPLRTRYGTVRDLIIGISIIRADGVMARGGGKVVKNVAGFDLPKLMVGSLGTLGMIATATFRLHPLPEVSETLVIRDRSAAELRALMAAMKKGQLEAAAIAAIGSGRKLDVIIRFEGFRAGVVEQRDRLAMLPEGSGACEVLDPGAAATLWSRHDAVRSGGTLRLKITALPSAIETVSGAVVAPLLGGLRGGGFVWYPSAGAGFVTGTPEDDERTATAIRAARQLLEQGRGSLTIESAPQALRALVAVWPDGGAAIPIMRAMKERFDPGRRLAPGRFIGGI
jgi:glycolate oxidase FAD binding subunit